MRRWDEAQGVDHELTEDSFHLFSLGLFDEGVENDDVFTLQCSIISEDIMLFEAGCAPKVDRKSTHYYANYASNRRFRRGA